MKIPFLLWCFRFCRFESIDCNQTLIITELWELIKTFHFGNLRNRNEGSNQLKKVCTTQIRITYKIVSFSWQCYAKIANGKLSTAVWAKKGPKICGLQFEMLGNSKNLDSGTIFCVNKFYRNLKHCFLLSL